MTRFELLNLMTQRAQRFRAWRPAEEIGELLGLHPKPVGLMLSKLAREGTVEMIRGTSRSPQMYRLAGGNHG